MSRIPSLDVTALVELGERFVAAGRADEAVQLLEMARRVAPDDPAVHQALARARPLARQPLAAGPRSIEQTVREQLRRDALDAKHFLGLAHLWRDRGEIERALAYLEIAAARDLPNPAPHKLHARLLVERGDYRRAVPQLNRARRYNPFDRETCELLGRACAEIGEHEAALAAWVDAFLLVPTAQRARADGIKRQIQELKDRLAWANERLHGVFRQRQEELRVAFDRLAWHHQRFLEGSRASRPAPRARARRSRLDLAARLRQLDVWSHLSDENVFALAAAAHDEELARGEALFAHGDAGTDLYVLERGEISIVRRTAYGTHLLGLVKPGELFGEMALLTGAPRSGEAIATQPAQLIRLDGGELARRFEEDAALGARLFWSFWHGLAFKLRATNDQLRSFFPQADGTESRPEQRRLPSEAREVRVALEAKAAVLREKGLSGRELEVLVELSGERSYPGGAWIFREGEAGREMFVVLDGRVRIGKRLPGAGEEALAILGRGDFFGEMSLIDGQPRSADARAHGGPATVVAIGEETLRQVLDGEPQAAFAFLRLLCRLVAERLREIDEKLLGWRILAGHESLTA